ncbi:hypothetical protein [Microbacterium sp. AK031]|uniref:hypothetical protein n=1 Tax=Microbacterium sp. AK031 TaxID=2723076 RepID=UPI00216A1D42|nr:hypothetical protein [Microbacterium sp. AK031]MCS3842114.1 hypothetical protein [Microbacterium sp. AK031]
MLIKPFRVRQERRQVTHTIVEVVMRRKPEADRETGAYHGFVAPALVVRHADQRHRQPHTGEVPDRSSGSADHQVMLTRESRQILDEVDDLDVLPRFDCSFCNACACPDCNDRHIQWEGNPTERTNHAWGQSVRVRSTHDDEYPRPGAGGLLSVTRTQYLTTNDGKVDADEMSDTQRRSGEGAFCAQVRVDREVCGSHTIGTVLHVAHQDFVVHDGWEVVVRIQVKHVNASSERCTNVIFQSPCARTDDLDFWAQACEKGRRWIVEVADQTRMPSPRYRHLRQPKAPHEMPHSDVSARVAVQKHSPILHLPNDRIDLRRKQESAHIA